MKLPSINTLLFIAVLTCLACTTITGLRVSGIRETQVTIIQNQATLAEFIERMIQKPKSAEPNPLNDLH